MTNKIDVVVVGAGYTGRQIIEGKHLKHEVELEPHIPTPILIHKGNVDCIILDDSSVPLDIPKGRHSMKSIVINSSSDKEKFLLKRTDYKEKEFQNRRGRRLNNKKK